MAFACEKPSFLGESGLDFERNPIDELSTCSNPKPQNPRETVFLRDMSYFIGGKPQMKPPISHDKPAITPDKVASRDKL